MSEAMEITLRTLTPLWTGGVETGRMERVHETGILGSLRWWYEVIVRGLGGDVCDPTSEISAERCQFDTKAYEKTKSITDGLASVCPVCHLFGCTGWKRRFELQATATQMKPFWLATRDRPGKFNHWWLSEIHETQNNNVAVDQMSLNFRWMRGYEHQNEVMRALLSLISELGALGAKPQYGFGIFSFADSRPISQSLSLIQQTLVHPKPGKNLSGEYQSLSDYWRLQCLVPEEDVRQQFGTVNVVGDQRVFSEFKKVLLPVSFDIRYKLPGSSDKGLRQAYRLHHGKMPTRRLFGTLKGSERDKRASSVFVSHLYKESQTEASYQLRVWGFSDSGLVGEIEQSLKDIFPNITVSQKTIGAKLLHGMETVI